VLSRQVQENSKLSAREFWERLGVDHRRASESCRFFFIIRACPILLNTTFSHITILKHYGAVCKRAELDEDFKALLQQTSKSLKCGVQDVDVQGMPADTDADLEELGKRKRNFLFDENDEKTSDSDLLTALLTPRPGASAVWASEEPVSKRREMDIAFS